MPDTPAKPVYVLHGQDAYLRRQQRRQIVERFTRGADPQWVVTDLDASAGLSEVLDALRTPPFLSSRRLVIVREADSFVTAHRQQLEAYLNAPAPTGSLMLVVDSWQASTRLARLCRNVGEVADCSSPAESELPEWIAAAVGARGKRMADEAVDLLAEWIGADLGRLDSEIEKLALYVGTRRLISTEDVEAVVMATAGAAPFALARAIQAGDAAEALELMAKTLTRRGEEFRVLGLLGWQLRRQRTGAWRARRRTGRGGGLSAQFRRVLYTDLAMKTGADPRTAMQLLVTRLCL